MQRSREYCHVIPSIEIRCTIDGNGVHCVMNTTVIGCVSKADEFINLRRNPYAGKYFNNWGKCNQPWAIRQAIHEPPSFVLSLYLKSAKQARQICVYCSAIPASDVSWAINANAIWSVINADVNTSAMYATVGNNASNANLCKLPLCLPY